MAVTATQFTARTIKDVAREAGVSIATVSRVCNGSALVSETTRLHVREIAVRLGYSPHGAARSLIMRRTSTIGALFPDLYGEFFSEVIRGVDQTARRHGYHVLVSRSHDESRGIEAALGSMRGRVDGLIVMSPDLDARIAMRSLPARFPLVLLNSAMEYLGDGAAFDGITVANFDGAYAMVNHLIGLGHRSIAIVTGPPRNHDATERLRGYRAAIQEAALPLVPGLEVAGDFSEASGYEAAAMLVSGERGAGERGARPDAIFCANDSMAIGALSALREHGLRVPEDIGVAGFDDIPIARYVNPQLTTVHVDISALGERATRLLFSAVDGEPRREKRQELLATTLVIRGSCGAPASARYRENCVDLCPLASL